MRAHELPHWLERRLRSRGLRADAGAVQLLAERVQGNLLAAAQEVDKLVLLDDGRPLDAARMEQLIAESARYDVFGLVDAALNGQPAQVARMLAGLQAEGEAVPALMGMVTMELLRAAAPRAEPRRAAATSPRNSRAASVGFKRRPRTRARCRATTPRNGNASSPRPGAWTASPRDAWAATRGAARTPAARGRRPEGAARARGLSAMLEILYGGSFDPVHEGHLAVARNARDAVAARCR